jgi:GTP pyrophosphokinase
MKRRKLLKAYKLKISQDRITDITKRSTCHVKELLQELVGGEITDFEPEPNKKVLQTDDYFIDDNHNVDLNWQNAATIGDEICHSGEGIKVHRRIVLMPEVDFKYGYRIVKARGAKGQKPCSPLRLYPGENDPNLLNNISTVLSKDLKISLHSINLDNADGMFKGRLKISIRDTGHLDTLLARLSAIKGVYRVTRVERYGP